MPNDTNITDCDQSPSHRLTRNASLLIKGLIAFNTMREDGARSLNNYTHRLVNEIQLNPVIQKEQNANKWIKVKSVLIFSKKMIAQLSAFSMQFKQLKKMSSTGSILSIPFSAKRLDGPLLKEKPRKYLKSLTANTVNVSKENQIHKDIDSTDAICIFEPAMFSELWQYKKVMSQERIFIIDVSFLFFVFLRNFLSTFPGFIKNFIQGYKQYRIANGKKLSASQVKELFVASLVTESYRQLYANNDKYTAYYLTSNSFVTEVLRIYHLMDEKCINLCEVMHGVSSCEYEKYLSQLLSSVGQNTLKHRFISQVPDFYLYGVFKENYWHEQDVFINTYLNKYLMKHDLFNDKSYLQAEAEKILGLNVKAGNRLVISFVGAMSHDKDYFSSPAFLVECQLIKSIEDYYKNKNHEIIIIYTPHPGHEISHFMRHVFFQVNNRVVYPETILTWFIADVCVSLHSSALFEAAFFGIHTFTPVNCEDEFYPAELLAYLHKGKAYPLEVTHKLANFLNDCLEITPLELKNKIEKRVMKLH